ncbi:MAG: class I SAM-dependent methyltransferase [Bryobacteraceae bacterium]
MKPIYEGNTIEGWMSNDELQWLYETACTMTSILEVGSWMGRSTHALLSGCRGPVYAVDTFKGTPRAVEHVFAHNGGDVRAKLMENVGMFPNLIVIQADSADAAKRFNPRSFEMIFIDGDHSYSMVMRDIKAWLPIARTMLCGHDRHQDGVPQALKDCGYAWKEEAGTIWSIDPNAPPRSET